MSADQSPRGGCGIWVVIPVKSLRAAKSRLCLPEHEQQRITSALFDHVLDTAISFAGAHNVTVVSRDNEVINRARGKDAFTLLEQPGGTLNDALSCGAELAERHGANAVLSLFSDLPHLSINDLRDMARLFNGANLVIAPDRFGMGSNALLMKPNAISYCHGPASFWRHLDEGRKAGLTCQIIRRAGLMQDLDHPTDYQMLLRKGDDAFLNRLRVAG